MVESFQHEQFHSDSSNKESTQLSDMLRDEFLEKRGERKQASSSGEQFLNFSSEFKPERKDGREDFVQAGLDVAAKRSNIAVGQNGRWTLD